MNMRIFIVIIIFAFRFSPEPWKFLGGGGGVLAGLLFPGLNPTGWRKRPYGSKVEIVSEKKEGPTALRPYGSSSQRKNSIVFL